MFHRILPLLAVVCLQSLHVQAGQEQTVPEILIPIRMPGDPPITLPAVAEDSGLPLNWEVLTGPATVSANVVTLTGGHGPVTLKVTQPGDATWDPLMQHVCFSVTEDGGFIQVCRREQNSPGIYGLTRTGRIIGFNSRFYHNIRHIPVLSPPGMRWRYISPGINQALHAIAEDGSLWHWPRWFTNAPTDPLGDAVAPVRIGMDQDWEKVTAGDSLRLAIKTDGSLWGWQSDVGQIDVWPLRAGNFVDWKEASMTTGNLNITLRNGGEAYFVQSATNPTASPLGTPWKTASISYGGAVGLKQDGTLWFMGAPYSPDRTLSPDTNWQSVGSLRLSYAALRQDGSVWGGDLNNGSTKIQPPTLYPTVGRWSMLSAGVANVALLNRDGSVWNRYIAQFPSAPATGPNLDGGFSRVAPAFFPQTLDFMTAREQPFPVVSGSTLIFPESALNSRLPLELTLVSGPAVITGQSITFTGPGPVEVNFRQKGNGTWGAFEERRTFLSQAPGPEIAVHDGTSASTPPRANNGIVVDLGRKTKAAMAGGLTRSFVIENTGTDPLSLTGLTAEAVGPLTFTTPFSPALIPPGAVLPLELTLHASEYGTHTLAVLLHSDDADEPAYRIPFQVVLANTPPLASTGPDRQVHAGSMLRLDGSFFARDLEQSASSLTYHWDLDGTGYLTTGAVQEIILPHAGQTMVARLRVTDGDGATVFSECKITAVPPGMEIPPAIRAGQDSEFEFAFRGTPGKKYRLFVSWDLVEWMREDDHYSPKSPVMVCGPDGFFTAACGPMFAGRTYYRAQEVTE